jgi:murein DD-endopeptidase MepM/ murein hydrolase activator NlpD
MRGRILGLLLVGIAVALTGYVYTRLEGKAPRVVAPAGPVFVGREKLIELRVDDEGTGVQEIKTWLRLENGSEVPLQTQRYPGDLLSGAEANQERELKVSLRPADLGVKDGTAALHVEARDYSWRRNAGLAEVPIVIDTARPRIAVTTGLTYVRRGGAELAVYRIDEEVERHGVRVGEATFPGYPHPSDPALLVAFYAIPAELPRDAKPSVVAVDRAENEAAVPLAISIVERSFPEDSVQLSDDFLQRKVQELLPDHKGDLLEGYLKINRDLRERDAERIREVCERSSEKRLWTEPFLQLPNSQVNARYAEKRSYHYQGRLVDQQSHMGFDFASTARAPTLAANSGVVAFAGPLGIYGNTVILDHGLGVFSLYGHLSEVTVKEGEAVTRGQPMGRTGDTGLAGGDHLHFSMLVGGLFVDPLEWFDEGWIRDHVEAELGGSAASEAQL